MAVPIYSQGNANPVIDNPVKLFLGATDFAAFGTATLTRTSKGIYYWSIPASGTVQLVASLRALLRNLQSSIVSYTKAGTVNGALSIKNVTANYLVTVANLTSASLTVTATTFPADNTATAPTVVDLLPAAALSTGFRANLYQTTFTPANPALLPVNTDELTTELIFVAPASSVTRFYGLDLNLNWTAN